MNQRAVFLDRDGVLTTLVFNPKTDAFESPLTIAELSLMPNAIEATRRLQDAGYLVFVVSNQPNYAKGKASLENMRAIAERFWTQMSAAGVRLSKAYYCYHHPNGVVPEYSYACLCRKPKPQFLFDAAQEFGIDLSQSWMIGDQETDVDCGRRAGCRTVLVENPLSEKRRPGRIQGTYKADDVAQAVEKLLNSQSAKE